MKPDGIGASVRRKEDPKFLTGRGRYVGDITVPGELHLAFVRSLHAHATIRAIDTSAALAMPGVVAVLTGADLAGDGINPIPSRIGFNDRHGKPVPEVPRPALVDGAVRVVGDPVAAVVVADWDTAHDAAEAVHVDYYDDKPALVTMTDALASDAPSIWDHVPGNLAFDWAMGDPAAVDDAFARAAHVVALDLINNRITANPMEPRLMIAEPDTATGGLKLTIGNQAPHLLRTGLSRILGMAESDLHVVSPNFGGGFGMRGGTPYPEDVVACWAARRLGRPVRWDRNAPRSDADRYPGPRS